MKNFVLFVASSNELYEDRVVLGDIVRELDDYYEPQGLRIRLKKWEDMPSYYMTERSQDAYNKKIESSHLFVMLLHEHLGKYTREEFEMAMRLEKDRLVFVKRRNGVINPDINSHSLLEGIEKITYDHASELKNYIKAKVDDALMTGLYDVQIMDNGPCDTICITINNSLDENNIFDSICIRDTVRMLNDLYEQYNKRIRIVSQDQLDQNVYIALINGATNELPVELQAQLNGATHAYHQAGQPLIYMYIRQYNEGLFKHIEEVYTHFARAYTTEESLKLYLITELQHTHLRGAKALVTATDILYVNNEPVLDLKKVEWVQNNRQIMDLIGQADKLKESLRDLESCSKEETNAKGELRELHQQINFTIGHIYNVVEKLVECQDGDNSDEIRRLYEMLRGGDYEGVERELAKILTSEPTWETQVDTEYNKAKSFFRYYDIARDLILVRVGGEEGFKLACEKYEEEIGRTCGRLRARDEAELHMEYGDFLRERKDEHCKAHYESSIASWIYAKNCKHISAGEYRTNMIKCNLSLATHFWDKKNYVETQRYIDEGLKLRDDLIAQGDQQIGSDYYCSLAVLYDTYGLLCVERVTNSDDGQKLLDDVVRRELIDAIEQKYDQAVALFKNVDDMRIDSQDALGSVHSNRGRACWQLYKIDGSDKWFEQAEESLKTAIAIRREVGGLPAIYEPRLVFPINNMGELYFSRAQKQAWNREDLERSRTIFLEAKERLDRHISYNIQTYGPRSAGIEARIARTMAYLGEFDEAKRLICKARQDMDFYTRSHPEVYTFRLEELEDIEKEIKPVISGARN